MREVFAALLAVGLLVAGFLVGVTAPAGAPVAGGSISQWGGISTPPPAGFDFIAVAGGGEHGSALRADGSLVSWGRNWFGEVSDTPSGSDFTAVAAGDGHGLALRADGSLVSWGDDWFGQVSDTPEGSDFAAIAAGYRHSLALRADGSLVSWGNDEEGQVSDTPAGTDFVAVAAGCGHSLALRADGSIAAWGWSNQGQGSPPAGDDYMALSAGYQHNLALRADGSIVAWGLDDHGQVSGTPAGEGFVAVAAGLYHSLALRADGSITAWGDDSVGQVLQKPAGDRFVAVASGRWFGLALASGPPEGFGKAAPVDGASGRELTLTLSWAAAPAATSYEYCVDTSDDDACGGWVDAGSGTSVIAGGLAPATTYYWQVRAMNGWGSTEADGGTWWSFTTGPPAEFGKAVPADGATGQSADLSLSWEPAEGAASYVYCLDAIDDGLCSRWVGVGTATDAPVSGAAYETTYYWQVRAINGLGTTESDGGAWWSFTTKPAPEIEEVSLRSVGRNDGWVLERDGESGKGSNVRDTTAPTGRVGDDHAGRQYRSILDFDTGVLPDDAVVVGVAIRVRPEGFTGANPFTTHGVLKVDVKTGAFHGRLELERYDFHAIGSRGNAGRFLMEAGSDWYLAFLRAASYPSVNPAGHTQFRLRFDLDDDDDGAADFLSFFTGDATAADRPELIIRYYVP